MSQTHKRALKLVAGKQTNRPKIVLVSEALPFSRRSGVLIRNAALAAGLAKIGNVTVIGLSDKDGGQVPPDINMLRIFDPNVPSLWAQRTLSQPLVPPLSNVVKTAFRTFIEAETPDVVVVNSTVTAGVLPLLAGYSGKVILDLHNIDAQLLAAILRSNPYRFLPRTFVSSATMIWCARRQEKRAVEQADHVWVCSHDDAKEAKALWGVDAAVIHTPVPDRTLFDLPINAERYAQGKILFVGLLSYRPNQQAIASLINKIMPKLPEMRLQIIGSANENYRFPKMPENVALEINLPDLKPLIAAAGFSAMPIVTGGGTRIKATEAMAAGVAIVATEKAVEGLGMRDGEHYLRAETPEAFCASLQSLHKQPQKAAEMATRARQHAFEHYSEHVINNQMASQIETILRPVPAM